jgi:hypothetical protein
MTHKERESYVQRLMAALEGDAPGTLVTESGELEAPSHTVDRIPRGFCPWRILTNADRRDRAALRAIRAEVLQASPFADLPRGADLDPLGYIAVLSHVDRFQEDPEHELKRKFPPQVWAWVYRYGLIELRATRRWLNRGYDLPDNDIIWLCQVWITTILMGGEHLLTGNRN